MAAYVMKMNNLASKINRCGLKDLSFEVCHKANVHSLVAMDNNTSPNYKYVPVDSDDDGHKHGRSV